MRKLLLLIGFFFLTSCSYMPNLSPKPINNKPPLNKKQINNKPAVNNQFLIRTTAYTHSESDHIKYGRKNALGTQLKAGQVRSAAADWSVFPAGTQFKIEGFSETFVIDDYGSALVGTKIIDLYLTSKEKMRRWGVRHVNIEVIKWGCYDQSKKILSGRTKHSHVRRMLAAINNKKDS